MTAYGARVPTLEASSLMRPGRSPYPRGAVTLMKTTEMKHLWVSAPCGPTWMSDLTIFVTSQAFSMSCRGLHFLGHWVSTRHRNQTYHPLVTEPSPRNMYPRLRSVQSLWVFVVPVGRHPHPHHEPALELADYSPSPLCWYVTICTGRSEKRFVPRPQS